MVVWTTPLSDLEMVVAFSKADAGMGRPLHLQTGFDPARQVLHMMSLAETWSHGSRSCDLELDSARSTGHMHSYLYVIVLELSIFVCIVEYVIRS